MTLRQIRRANRRRMHLAVFNAICRHALLRDLGIWHPRSEHILAAAEALSKSTP